MPVAECVSFNIGFTKKLNNSSVDKEQAFYFVVKTETGNPIEKLLNSILS